MIALAMLIAGKLSHCAYEDGRELSRHANLAAQLRAGIPTPMQRSQHDCENESGCLCGGATLAQAVDSAALDPVETGLIRIDVALVTSQVAEVAAGLLPIDSHLPPISGRQLRARLASLVI